MKYLVYFVATLFVICLGSAPATAQAGRRQTTTPQQPSATYTVPLTDEPAPSGHIKQDAQDATIFRCVGAGQADDDASASTSSEEVFSSKDVTTKAQILSKPDPVYTREARRNGTRGTVVLRVLLSSSARVTEIKVLDELPDGLTENAVKAACAIRFKPAMKDERAVAQYVMVKYNFMADPPTGTRTRRLPFPPRP